MAKRKKRVVRRSRGLAGAGSRRTKARRKHRGFMADFPGNPGYTLERAFRDTPDSVKAAKVRQAVLKAKSEKDCKVAKAEIENTLYIAKDIRKPALKKAALASINKAHNKLILECRG